MDLFIEHIVKRKSDYIDVLKKTGIIIGALVLCMIVPSLLYALVPPIANLALAFDAAIVYGAYLLVIRCDIEFEYIVTNGELDVDKIIARRSRKRLLSVHSKNFEICAPTDHPLHQNQQNGSAEAKVIDASDGTGAGAFFCIFNRDGERIKLIFQPTPKMLAAFKQHSPRNVHWSPEAEA